MITSAFDVGDCHCFQHGAEVTCNTAIDPSRLPLGPDLHAPKAYHGLNKSRAE